MKSHFNKLRQIITEFAAMKIVSSCFSVKCKKHVEKVSIIIEEKTALRIEISTYLLFLACWKFEGKNRETINGIFFNKIILLLYVITYINNRLLINSLNL